MVKIAATTANTVLLDAQETQLLDVTQCRRAPGQRPESESQVAVAERERIVESQTCDGRLCDLENLS